MKETVFNKYGIKQLGYYVESIEETADLFVKTLGSGPFVDMGINPPKSCLYKGEEIELRSRCALGHLGDIQIELIEVVSDEDDPYKDAGGYGFHHFCIWSDDVDKAVEEFAQEGIEPAMIMESGQGLKVVYFDAREKLGSYVEVNPPLDQMWNAVKTLAEHSDGQGPSVIGIEVLMKGMGK